MKNQLSYPELSRVVKSLSYVQQTLSLKVPVFTEIISTNNKLNATLNLDQGFYDNCRISVKISAKSDKEEFYHIQSYPIVEFNSILSIVTSLLPKIKFLSENPTALTATFVKDAILNLRTCEEILTIRKKLTNVGICPDWNSGFEVPPNDNTFVSVFPFRESLYVTVYIVEETTLKPRELHTRPSPFNFATNSVITINGKNYIIRHSIIGKQSQQFLSQVLRWIRDSIDELESVVTLVPSFDGFEDDFSNSENPCD
ncbi:hypothetical protein GPJ56_001928 [Histomonas meleagridis]|uniref:uncharacterized protein n=1 Tax=Histomonas meleagridis TaxID=135588 RepID=UPI00355A5B6B|nr:hypothetical protein GPJ56_001928 [Histomonas meleagridis]KAH0800996.1 hypothetical protein GO595_006312 [Histomonas meleagridis]